MRYNKEMDLLSIKNIKFILAKHNAKPSKGMGQNFLVDRPTLNKIIAVAELTKEDVILEVGPGLGTLTQELAKRVKKVIAVEKDAKMIEMLKENLKDYKNIEIIKGDILKFSSSQLQASSFKVVANIPYYLTSPLIRKFLEDKNPPEQIILMVQKEIAQKICAKPPRMSLLSVSVQFYASPNIITYVSKNCFWPRPKVDSAIIKIVKSERRKVKSDVEKFFTIVKAGFSHPRKQLVNNLSTLKLPDGVTLDKSAASNWLLKNNISPNQRAETLSVDDWIKLTNSF